MDIKHLIGKLDLNHLTSEFMDKIKTGPLNLYFVIHDIPQENYYEMLGMSYSEGAAKDIRLDSQKDFPAEHLKVLHLDLGKLLKLIEAMGAVEEV